ncbi:MAG: DUF1302 domain-containing protein [Gammaproteobacteria bacterium]|nr:DUF1302 domain-containing protein [Gammaproteobacteria bacterium]
MSRHYRKSIVTRQTTLATLALLGFSPLSQALSFEWGEGGELRLDLDTNVAYSAQWRVEKRDRDKYRFRDTGDLIADLENYAVLVNANDGNNNFSRGIVQNKVSVVTEADLQWRDFGLFVRGRAYYDDVYDGKTDISAEDFANYNNNVAFPNGNAGFREFPPGTVNEHRDRLQLLDHFVYMDGELPGDRLFNLRFGSQVINWGEATFTPGINGLQNRADLIARNTPGVEVKEILLPTGSLYGQVDLAADVTFEAYYQYEWLETELNGVGSYFSDRDFLGFGARNFLIPLGSPDNLVAIPRLPDDNPPDSGQWGTALHWITENGTDFGLYYINAHSKAPAYQVNVPEGGLVPQSYTIKYFEDITGYAASFTTVLGITNVQGEVSLKQDVPVVLANGDPVKGDLIAWQLGGSHVLEPNRFWDDANLTFELAGAHVDNYDSSELRFDDHGTVLNLRLETSYLNIAPGLDLFVPIFFQRGLDGNILESEMVEDATAINITFKFVYLNNFTTQVGYSTFFDGGANYLISDRDNVSLNVSYSF